MAARPQRSRVLLLCDTMGYGRQILRGAIQYAQEATQWNYIIPAWGEDRDWRRDVQEYAGVLGIVRSEDLADELTAARAVVNASASGPGLRFASVIADDAAVAELAFEHLAGRGFTNLGYIGRGNESYDVARAKAFEQAVRRRGFRYVRFAPPPTTEATVYRRALEEWLREQPLPLALFAGNDSIARQVAVACRPAGLHVPQQVAIVGVDNDELVCMATVPPLSSVAIEGFRIGYTAAQTLDRRIAGRRVATLRRIPPLQVIARASTDATAVADTDVAAAIAYIEQNACKGVSVDDVASACALSRRTLERRFEAVLQRTVATELRRVRTNRATWYLSQTDLPLKRVARLCGYGTSKQFREAYRRATGRTPGTVRP